MKIRTKFQFAPIFTLLPCFFEKMKQHTVESKKNNKKTLQGAAKESLIDMKSDSTMTLIKLNSRHLHMDVHVYSQ